MKNSLIVLSGGMDSVTLLHQYQSEIALAVTFDYGSKHNAREIPCARLHCESLRIPHLVLPLDFINRYFSSSLLQSGGDIPEGHYADENMKSTVVPFRNGILLSIAAGLAESRGLNRVMMANHFGDHSIYPDCRESFVRPMGEAIRNGTYNECTLFAP
jgi:7-cyano-7-deazaguanine synthase